MAVPEYRDEVLITLTIADPPPSFSFPNRRIFLSKKNSSIDVGRTSKRNIDFEAAKCNAWFDSPVMSRKHARFTLDADKQKVYVRDTGSLHGTYKSDTRLETNVDYEVASGDMLKFGAFIERPQEKHYPCAMTFRCMYGSNDPDRRGNTFRVPEDSDIEDMSSEEDQVNNSYEMLRSQNLVPAKIVTSSSAIDLTLDDQYPLSSELPNHVSIAASQGVTTCPDDNAGEFSDLEDDEEQDEEETDVSQNSLDTDDSCDSISEAQSTNYAPSPIPDPYVEKNLIDDEEDFSGHDEFEEEQVPEEEHVHQEETMRSVEDQNEDTRFEADARLEENAMMIPTTRDDTANSFRAQVPTFSHQSNGVKTSQLGKGDCLWDPNLPPIIPIHMPANILTTMNLPPISSMSFDSYTPDKNPSATTAEAMGRKHGKIEFFAAREENKVRAQVQHRLSDLAPHKAPEPQRNPVQIGVEKPTPVMRVIELQKSDNDFHKLAVSDLASSGDKFLATPPQIIEPEVMSTEPELDESSAWAFEQSKDASAAEINTEAADQATATHDVDVLHAAETLENHVQEPVATKEVSVRPSKRKADEISQLIPGEKSLVHERLIRIRPRRGKFQSSGRLHQAPTAVAPPPHKRLRRMAEAVGYVALGGAAVMSVLIATAPAL
ncbi:Sarcolemmal membrane-associated protein [Fusarium austroafricanum]|uniref:Sarcolemmal membrane-associated protein n=1 Tax=Fusarium austroafricanum TaxID=2364996 RepID=A0A8H4P5W1_9HYPO|nr:Sarcolemmal membrane-associated protein [Fusarium austroafricanum]